MGISFVNPYILLLGIIIIVYLLLVYKKSNVIKNTKQKIVVIIRCFVILLILLSLSGIKIKKVSDSNTLLFVSDLSSSTEKSRDNIEDFINKAMKSKPNHYNTGVVAFGKDSVVEQSVSNNMNFNHFEAQPSPYFTNIDNALNMSSALLPDSTRKNIVLMTDGNQNLGDSIKRAKILLAQDIRIDGVYLDTSTDKEVQISSLDVPDSLYKGEQYNISTNIYSTSAQDGVLRLYSNRELISEKNIHIQKGDNNFVFSDIADTSGIKTYEAEISVQEDNISKNNKMSSFVNIKGLPSLAVVEGQEGDSREIVKILNAAQISIKKFSPKSLPSEIKELRKYNGIILNNVSADDLGDKKIELIDSYVKNLGRGLLVTGGDNSFALGGYMASGFEDMLPVSMDINQRAELPSLGQVLVIDKSGSMSSSQSSYSKIELAKEAAIRSLDVLRPIDKIGVIAFDDRASWVVDPQNPENIEQIKNDIGTIRDGGGTNIYAGLNLANEALKNMDTKIKHIILLTDGQSYEGNYAKMLKDMNDSSITLTTVAVGADSDKEFLKNLALVGKGRHYYTNQFNNLPKIFTKETYLATQAYVQNRTFYPVVTQNSPIIQQFKNGFPSLAGYITTSPKSRADIILSSDEDDPIFASWQYGLGKVATWTSDLRGTWASKWLNWNGIQDYWLNVISYILPKENELVGNITTENKGDKGLIKFNLSTSNDEIKNKAIVMSPNGKEQTINLEITQPGKYEGSFNIEESGVYLINLLQEKDGNIINNVDTGMAVTYSKEYDVRNTNSKELLEKIVSITGGKIINSPEEVFKNKLQPVWSETEIWPYLLIIALILFFIDILFRRLKIETFMNRNQEQIMIQQNDNYKRDKLNDKKVRHKQKQKSSKMKGNEKDHNEDDFTSKLLNARKKQKGNKD